MNRLIIIEYRRKERIMSNCNRYSLEYYENIVQEGETLERRIQLKSRNVKKLMEDICSLNKNIEDFRIQRAWLTEGTEHDRLDLSNEADKVLKSTDSIPDLVHNLEIEKAKFNEEHSELRMRLKKRTNPPFIHQ